MNVYLDRGREAEYAAGPVRVHPWETTDYGDDQSRLPGRYHDFKTSPELIRTGLEDFLPWSPEPAVEAFYRLLEWLNGPASPFETNDCAFGGGPKSHSDKFFAKRKLRCDGRVMIFYRDLPRNTVAWSSEWLVKRFSFHLERSDPKFVDGAVGLAKAPSHFTVLASPGETAGAGFLLMLHFFAYGDSNREAFKNLERLLRGVLKAAKQVAAECVFTKG